MDKIVMIGGKGSAVVIAEQIYDTQVKAGTVEFLGFAFDDERMGDSINGFPLLCKTYEAYQKYGSYSDVKFIYQLYRPDLMKERVNLLNRLSIPTEKFAIFTHHSVMAARSSNVGEGTVILANSILNANAVVGRHCTIQSNCLVGHDTKLGDYNFLAAHCVLGSNSIIGNGNFFGLNCTMNNYLTIGDYNFVGMSSNLTKGLETDKKVYGNPAKEFESKIKPL